jgi:acyl carrier protein
MWEFVDLGEAAERIRDHPEIKEIAAVRSPDRRLYVFVEQQGLNYGPVLRDIVLDEIETEHPDAAVAMVRDVPRIDADGAVDKAACVDLAPQVAVRGRWVFAIDPAETEEEKIIASLLLEILNAKRLSMTDSLPLLGADSLVLVELSGAITERFGVTLNAMDLFDVDNVRDLVRLVFSPESKTPA